MPNLPPNASPHVLPHAPRVIAAEEHYATEAYLAEVAGLTPPPGEEPEQRFMLGFQRNAEMRRKSVDLDVRLREMDASGTDVAVLSLNPPGVQMHADAGRAAALARALNDGLAEVVRRYPTRFAGIGSVAPQDRDGAAREIERIMGPLGLGGVMISSHTHGRYLDAPECEPILAAAEAARATIYLHPRVPSPQMLAPFRRYGMLAALWGYQAEAGTHAMRLILSGVFDRFPKLTVVLGHMGEALPFWTWRLDNMYARTYDWAGESLGMRKLRRRPSEYLRENFAVTTSGMDDPEVLAFCLRRLGDERMLFAIDYPYESSAEAVAFLHAAPLTDGQRALVSHGNAERLFRIAPAAAPAGAQRLQRSTQPPDGRGEPHASH